MGYDCRGESGTFPLRRRTPADLTVELLLDVGTWSSLVISIFHDEASSIAWGSKLS
jgi:hypothetical protein